MRVFLSYDSLVRLFSYIKVHQDHIENLLKHKFLGLSLRISDSMDLAWYSKMCISNETPGDAFATDQLPHFENHQSN